MKRIIAWTLCLLLAVCGLPALAETSVGEADGFGGGVNPFEEIPSGRCQFHVGVVRRQTCPNSYGIFSPVKKRQMSRNGTAGLGRKRRASALGKVDAVELHRQPAVGEGLRSVAVCRHSIAR